MIKAPFNSSFEFTTCSMVDYSHDPDILLKTVELEKIY